MSLWTYVEWHQSWSRRGEVWEVLDAAHPLVLNPCLLCREQIGTELPPQLLIVGPVEEAQWDAHLGSHLYQATAVLVHALCLEKRDDDQVEDAVAEIAQYVQAATP